MSQSSLAVSVRLAIFLCIACGLATGCGGGSDQNSKVFTENGFNFSTVTLSSSCISLQITKMGTTFPAGTTVTFVGDDSKSYVGDQSPTAGATLYSGLPDTAPPGVYSVLVQEPGQQPQNAGQVDLETAGAC